MCEYRRKIIIARVLTRKSRVFLPPRGWFLLVAACLLASSCASRKDLTRSSTQENFGVEMARMNLWREAMFRFKRAVEIDPGAAVAHNNLAVAYEANGDFDNARKEYLEALRLDRSNQYIQKNYSRYVEFLSRNKKRQSKDVKTASTPAATPAPEASSATPPATPPAVVPSPAPAPQPPPPTPPT